MFPKAHVFALSSALTLGVLVTSTPSNHRARMFGDAHKFTSVWNRHFARLSSTTSIFIHFRLKPFICILIFFLSSVLHTMADMYTGDRSILSVLNRHRNRKIYNKYCTHASHVYILNAIRTRQAWKSAIFLYCRCLRVAPNVWPQWLLCNTDLSLATPNNGVANEHCAVHMHTFRAARRYSDEGTEHLASSDDVAWLCGKSTKRPTQSDIAIGLVAVSVFNAKTQSEASFVGRSCCMASKSSLCIVDAQFFLLTDEISWEFFSIKIPYHFLLLECYVLFTVFQV